MKLTQGMLSYGFTKCRACAHVKSLASFRQWTQDGKAHRSTKCLSCEQGRPVFDIIVSNPAKPPAWHGKDLIIKEAKAIPCADCGRSFTSVCMDFDHKDASKKLFNVSQIRDHRPETIRAEIAKCDVVCACCHRLRTHKRGYVGTGRPKNRF